LCETRADTNSSPMRSRPAQTVMLFHVVLCWREEMKSKPARAGHRCREATGVRGSARYIFCMESCMHKDTLSKHAETADIHVCTCAAHRRRCWASMQKLQGSAGKLQMPAQPQRSAWPCTLPSKNVPSSCGRKRCAQQPYLQTVPAKRPECKRCIWLLLTNREG